MKKTDNLRIYVNSMRVGVTIVAVQNQEVLRVLTVYMCKYMCVCLCVCVCVVLFAQHSKRMRHVISSSMSCLVLPYFFSPTLSHKRHDFRRKEG